MTATSLAAGRGSHLGGALRLDLVPLGAALLRRATVPSLPTQPQQPLVFAFSVGTAASRGSLAAHARQISVVSPTGLSASADGSLRGAPDADALATAASAGVPVWPLVQNQDFDPTAVSQLLRDQGAQGRLVDNLRGLAAARGFAGIHLDFEQVPGTDRDRLSELVARLGKALHADGRRLAVDVIPHKPGHLNAYSEAYDLRALAAGADFVTVMAYEQHGAHTSPGPVAGLDWDRQVLAGTLPDLATPRTLLGLALYARSWSNNGSSRADSYAGAVGDAVSAAGARIDYDFGAATPFVHAADGALTYFDDADSLARKLALVPEQKLAGIAIWRLGFEDPAVWTVLPGTAARP
jgi:spore germination protein YaaH